MEQVVRTHPAFNLDKYEGRARSKYVWDPVVLPSATLTAATSGLSGSATITSTAATAAPYGATTRINTTTTNPSSATLKAPIVLARSNYSAMLVEIEGIFIIGRPAIDIQLGAQFSENGVGVRLDSTSIRQYVLRAGNATPREERALLAGNVTDIIDGRLGIWVDWDSFLLDGGTHFSFSKGRVLAPAFTTTQMGGGWEVKMVNTTAGVSSTFGFRRMTITGIMKYLGGENEVTIR